MPEDITSLLHIFHLQEGSLGWPIIELTRNHLSRSYRRVFFYIYSKVIGRTECVNGWGTTNEDLSNISPEVNIICLHLYADRLILCFIKDIWNVDTYIQAVCIFVFCHMYIDELSKSIFRARNLISIC